MLHIVMVLGQNCRLFVLIYDFNEIICLKSRNLSTNASRNILGIFIRVLQKKYKWYIKIMWKGISQKLYIIYSLDFNQLKNELSATTCLRLYETDLVMKNYWMPNWILSWWMKLSKWTEISFLAKFSNLYLE